MPHESTVAHEQRFVMETPMISRTRTFRLPDEEEEQTRLMTVSTYSMSYNLFRKLGLMQQMVYNCLQKALEIEQNNIQIPHARPETPRNVTHTHDEDCSDEDSDSQKQGNSEKSSTKKTEQP